MPSLMQIVPLLSVVLLTGCMATGSDLHQPKPVVAKAPVPQQRLPIAKDAKLFKTGKPVNDYLNSSVPSQVQYSLHVLNQESQRGEYPIIQDVSDNATSLRSLEERRILEEELQDLSQR